MERGTHSPDPASALRGRACVQPTQSDQGHREPFPADLRQSHRAIPSVPTFPAKLFVPTLPLPGISLPPPMPESSHPLAIKTLSAKNLPSPIETSAQCNFLSPSPREACVWHPLPLQKVRKDNGELGAGLRGRCVPDTKRSQTHHPGAQWLLMGISQEGGLWSRERLAWQRWQRTTGQGNIWRAIPSSVPTARPQILGISFPVS